MRPQDKKGLAVAVAALGAAIATELKKPAEERTWHGTIAGVVPYDLRVPTQESVRQKLWNPAGNFWSPQVFGVGWSPNFGRLAAQLGLLGPEAAQATRPPDPARPTLPTADPPTDDEP
jgi:hypothetical protein